MNNRQLLMVARQLDNALTAVEEIIEIVEADTALANQLVTAYEALHEALGIAGSEALSMNREKAEETP